MTQTSCEALQRHFLENSDFVAAHITFLSMEELIRYLAMRQWPAVMSMTSESAIRQVATALSEHERIECVPVQTSAHMLGVLLKITE